MRKKFFILGVIIVLVAIAVFFSYQKNRSASLINSTVLADRSNNLTPEQKQIFLDKIAKGEEYLKSINPKQLTADRQYSNLYLFMAQQYFGLGKLQQAKEFFEKSLLKDPASQGAVEGLSLTFLAAGDMESAGRLLEGFLKNYPDSVNVWLQYFTVSDSMGKSAQDLYDVYEEALSSTNRDIDIITSDASFQEKTGNIDKALELWEEAAEKYPTNAAIYQNEISRLKQLMK